MTIDLIPFVEFTQSDKQLYGSIIGSVLGALTGVLVGAGITFFFTIAERRRNDDSTLKIRRNDQYVLNHKALMMIRGELDLLLIANRQNYLRLDGFLDGIYDPEKDVHRFMVNIPKEYPSTTFVKTDILNVYISVTWDDLEGRLQVENSLIREFNELYVPTREATKRITLEGGNINTSAIISESEAIKNAAKAQLTNHVNTYNSLINTLACVEAFGDYYIKTDKELMKSGATYTTLIENLISHRPNKRKIEKHAKKLREEYDQKLTAEPITSALPNKM